MNKFRILITVISLFYTYSISGQNNQNLNWENTFESEWEKIDEFVKDGKRGSAYDLAKSVFYKSVDLNNATGLVKALIAMSENVYHVDDDAISRTINDLEKVTGGPVMEAFVDSYLAELYQLYLEKNRYRISQISVSGPESPDIALWDEEQFLSKIQSLFKSSLEAPALKEISSKKAEHFIEEKDNYLYELRPTIFDLLADRYVGFLSNTRFQNEIVPIYLQEDCLDNLLGLEMTECKNQDSARNESFQNILLVFGEWENFHKTAGNTSALLSIMDQRLDYITNTVENVRDSSYIDALDRLMVHYSDAQYLSVLYFKKARNLFSANEYTRAMEVIEEGMKFDSNGFYSFGIEKLKQLKVQIESMDLEVQVEFAYPIGQLPLLSIGYRNIDEVHFDLFDLKEEEFVSLAFDPKERNSVSEIIAGKMPIWKDRIDLLSPIGYSRHSTEWYIDQKLKSGQYLLCYYYDGEKTKIKGTSLFQVSNIKLLEVSQSSGNKYFVQDRLTGELVANAEITSKVVDADRSTMGGESKTLKIQPGGFYLFPNKRDNRRVSFRIQSGKDVFLTPLSYHRSYVRHPEREHLRSIFFTDRAVYQPGQTVFFKGLIVSSKELTSKILTDQKITVYLRDPNGREVWNKSFVSDEWGAIAGEIPLPISGLNGGWTIGSSLQGQQSIQVEAYTRPNFEILCSDTNFTVSEEMISAKGKAVTYAGFPIQEAEGRAEIWLKKSNRWMYLSNGEESEKLEVIPLTTDAEGIFDFKFKKIKKPESGTRSWSYHYYEIIVTIENPSGEIQTKEVQIPWKEDLMVAEMSLGERWNLEKEGEVKVTVSDASNRPAEFSGSIVLSELEVPENFKVNRFWNAPDTRIIDKSVFEKEFKSYRFSDGDAGSIWNFSEKDYGWNTWQVSKEINSWNLRFLGTSKFDLSSKISNPGYYRVEMISDAGDTLATQTFYGYNRGAEFELIHKAFDVIMDKDKYTPGDVLEMKVLKNADLKNVILVFDGQNRGLQTKVVKEDRFLLELSEKDRGGIQFIVLGQLANRNFRESVFIEIPWKDKELDIQRVDSISSIDVNTESELSFTVNNLNEKGVPSQVAIAIYDASLDAYRANDWSVRNVFFRRFNSYIPIYDMSGNLGFVVTRKNNYWDDKNRNIKEMNFPILPSINLMDHRPLMMRGMDRMADDAVVVGYGNRVKSAVVGTVEESESANVVENTVELRQDFSENLLFVGKAQTDSMGEIGFSFKTNDKVGRWKVLVLAHDKELASGTMSFEFSTKKDLYIEDYLPEYLRQGDAVNLRFSVFNTTQKPISGSLKLKVESPDRDEKVLVSKLKKYDLSARGSGVLNFVIEVDPEQIAPLVFNVSMTGDDGSILDQMQKVVPVYQTKELVHSGWVNVLESGEKYVLPDSLKVESEGELRVRVVRNMYTELLKSLPFLHNYSAKTTDQYLRNWMYAKLGLKVASTIPGFEGAYNEWKRKGDLEGDLSKQQDQKYEALANTPWVRQNNSQEEQMALLSLYFDRNRMTQSIQSNFNEWTSGQNADGGFPWIKGWPSDLFITGRVLEYIGSLMTQGIKANGDDLDQLIERAISYYDAENLKLWKKWNEDTLKIDNELYVAPDFMRYFTSRSVFVEDYPIPDENNKFWNSLLNSLKENWAKKSFSEQAGIGIAAFYLKEESWSKKIAEAFVDNVIVSEELGAYWRYNQRSMQSSYLDLHSSGMELLQLNGIKSLDPKLLKWILVNKMTNDWSQNPAVFQLILSAIGASNASFTQQNQVEITVNKRSEKSLEHDDNFTLAPEYRDGFEIGNFGDNPVWISVQLSQEVDLDDSPIKSGSELSVEKFVESGNGTDTTNMGDRLLVRLVLKTDRDLDYVYLEDPLVPGVDEGIALSGFQWDNGLSYYQTFDFDKGQFFIRHLPKGTHIIEYELGVVRSGNFGVPRTKVQSYYVPEISGWDHWKAKWEIGE